MDSRIRATTPTMSKTPASRRRRRHLQKRLAVYPSPKARATCEITPHDDWLERTSPRSDAIIVPAICELGAEC